MGRRKISIAPIKDERNRQVTFLKRKNGLFKKAYELGVLCSADVAIIVFNANGKLFEFHSGDMDQTLLRYSHYTGPAHEKRGPEDYLNQDLAATASKRGSGMSDEAEDEEESDEEKPHIAAGSSGVKVISNAAKGKQALRAAAERKSKLGDRSRSLSEDHPHHQDTSSLAGPPASSMYDRGSGAAELAAAGNAASGAHANVYQALPSLNLNGFNFASGPMSAMSQQTGFPSNFTSSAPLAFPNFAATGLPVPNFGFGLPGSAAWPNPFGTPAPAQSQQQGYPLPNGASVPSSSSSSSGGVPSWFGAPDPGNAALQSARDQLAQLPPMQLLQQLGGMSAQLGVTGWPGLGNVSPEAAMQALQQQAQQAQHLFQQQQQQQQLQQQQLQQRQAPNGQQFTAPESSPQSQHLMQPATVHPHPDPPFRPTPAPMYGSPAGSVAPTVTASQSQQNPTGSYGVPLGPGGSDIDRPGSSASIHSSHQSPARGRSIPPPPPGRQGSVRQDSSDSLSGYDRPRLQVAIPAEGRPNENTKPGLVTAGGASILGAGFSHRGASGLRGLQSVDERGASAVNEPPVAEEPQQHEVQRSAFAVDLLPSPFYPNASYSTDSAFAWPTSNTADPQDPADGPAPEHKPHSGAPETTSQYQPNHDHAADTSGGGTVGSDSGRRDSGGSSGQGSNGLDDLSQAARALSEGRHPERGPRTHLRAEEGGHSGLVEEAGGRGKRRKV